MLVVMPLGYGAPEIVSRTGPTLRDPNLRQRNYDKFRDALLTEVIPEVEKSYRAEKDRNSRAIAGLSMGGAESLYVGLNALNSFAWIGAFSSGGMGDNLDASFSGLDAKANARGAWCGSPAAPRIASSKATASSRLAQSEGHRAPYIETPGAHTWLVWRRYLAEFVPRCSTSRRPEN